LKVIHRVSISNFEVEHDKVNLDEAGNYISNTAKDKPWLMYRRLSEDNDVKISIEKIFDELINTESNENPFDKEFSIGLSENFKNWVDLKGIKDSRFIE
jgi:putative ATP-dependent endonuclease of OLD family